MVVAEIISLASKSVSNFNRKMAENCKNEFKGISYF